MLSASIFNYGQKKEDSILILIKQSREKSYLPLEKLNLLKKAYNKTIRINNDSIKTTYLSKMALVALRTQDSLFFRKVNAQTIKFAKQLKDSVVLAEAFWDLGSFWGRSLMKDSAYYSYSEAQKIYEAKGDLFS